MRVYFGVISDIRRVLAGPPHPALRFYKYNLPAGYDVHAMFAACSPYQKTKLSRAGCNPEPENVKPPSVKSVAGGINAISRLMDPGQQALQTELDSCFSTQMRDDKDLPQRFMIAFFPTIDEPGWLGPGDWLKPFLPIDPVTGRADDRHVRDYAAMMKEIHARQRMRLRTWQQDVEAGNKPGCKPSCPTSLDQLYDNHRRAMNEVTKQQHMLTHPGSNSGDSAADIRFWQRRIGGIGADPRVFTTAGSGRRPNDSLSGHPSMESWQKLVKREMLDHRTGLQGSSAQSMDLVAKSNHPHNPDAIRQAKNRLRELGICRGIQQNCAHPGIVYALERDSAANDAPAIVSCPTTLGKAAASAGLDKSLA
ncbi:hypothetical protein WJX74_001866 [Apatococcus lobatus]|uniref:Uncharacterized protein n=1 Tax=Apatococcus lobatus TaxID=904363 RepID=A0AAW1R3G1_9CHLO